MNLTADEFTERRIDHSVPSEATFSAERGRHNDGFVVPGPVRRYFDNGIWKALLDELRDCFRIHIEVAGLI